MAFLGIRVPAEIGKILKGIEVPGKAESPSEYHITLMFFADNWELSKVSAALEATFDVIKDIKPFTVKTDTVGCFPKRKDSSIPIIARVEGKELHELRDKLAEKFDKDNVEFSKVFKTFHPHITLAYHDSDKETSDFKVDPIEFTVSEVVLWAGDHWDDRLFIVFPIDGSEKQKKSSFLLQMSYMFYKIANNPPQPYLSSTTERRSEERVVIGKQNHYKYDQGAVANWLDMFSNNKEANLEEYNEFGAWSKNTFKIVPISDIEEKAVWQDSKVPPLLERMEKGLAIDPIKIGEHYQGGKWAITDGIHRIAASKMMGYTHIPAYVTEWIKESPPK